MGPKAANSGPATTKPSISPASVAASNRATALPRSSSSEAVAKAMNPRIDGTEAAVDAPSSSRVNPMTGRLTANAVMIDGDRAERRADEHHPPVADAVRQDPEDGREHELARVEQRPEDADLPRLHRLAAVLGAARRR